jgi:hypothetical protein
MIRFIAPPHIGTAFLSTGPVAVIDGAIALPDDLSLGDRAGLAASGFTSAPAEKAPPAKAASPQKGD